MRACLHESLAVHCERWPDKLTGLFIPKRVLPSLYGASVALSISAIYSCRKVAEQEQEESRSVPDDLDRTFPSYNESSLPSILPNRPILYSIK